MWRCEARIHRPAIHSGEKVNLTEHGEPYAEIVPVKRAEPRKMLAALQAIGQIDFPPRR